MMIKFRNVFELLFWRSTIKNGKRVSFFCVWNHQHKLSSYHHRSLSIKRFVNDALSFSLSLHVCVMCVVVFLMFFFHLIYESCTLLLFLLLQRTWESVASTVVGWVVWVSHLDSCLWEMKWRKNEEFGLEMFGI